MPNLEQIAVTAWLVDFRPGSNEQEWPPAIRPIETEPPVSAQLTSLGAALDAIAQQDLHTLAARLLDNPLRDDLMCIMAQLGAARALRLLHWMAEVELPECHRVISALMQNGGAAAKSLRAAVDAVTRQATVDRMFAPARITALELACNTLKEEV